jgi:hypothetical protein
MSPLLCQLVQRYDLQRRKSPGRRPDRAVSRCVAGTQGFALGYFRSRLWRDKRHPSDAARMSIA